MSLGKEAFEEQKTQLNNVLDQLDARGKLLDTMGILGWKQPRYSRGRWGSLIYHQFPEENDIVTQGIWKTPDYHQYPNGSLAATIGTTNRVDIFLGRVEKWGCHGIDYSYMGGGGPIPLGSNYYEERRLVQNQTIGISILSTPNAAVYYGSVYYCVSDQEGPRFCNGLNEQHQPGKTFYFPINPDLPEKAKTYLEDCLAKLLIRDCEQWVDRTSFNRKHSIT